MRSEKPQILSKRNAISSQWLSGGTNWKLELPLSNCRLHLMDSLRLDKTQSNEEKKHCTYPHKIRSPPA